MGAAADRGGNATMKEIIRGKNEAARGAANTADGIGRNRLGEADRSKDYSTTGFGVGQDRPVGAVKLFLPASGTVGATNAITSRRIKEALGYSDIRSFRSALEGERQRGALICGGSCGIYVPQDGEAGVAELERHLAKALSRAYAVSRWLSTIRRELYRRRYADQIEIGGVQEREGRNDG